MTSIRGSEDADGSRTRGGERADGRDPSPNRDRSRLPYGRALAVGLVLSLAGHLLAMELFPTLEAPELPGVVGEFQAVDVRPVQVETPPPPDPVPRPDVPQVREQRVEARSASVAAPALDAAPGVGALPPPPPPAEEDWSRPSYIEHQVAPRPDREELEQERLARFYPRDLQRQGVEGMVDLWVYVDRSGDVTRSRVIASSGHARMDTAAVKVARARNYLPALNRDKPIGVWVTQRICFVQEPDHAIGDDPDCAALVDARNTP